MAKINENFLNLQNNYLFSEIAQRTQKYIESNPNAKIIKLGIGDTTLPLPPSIIQAFHQGVDEMARKETYHGYGPEQGYLFLRNLIAEKEYRLKGVQINPDEIFISDGSKCDTGNILDIFGKNIVAICDPSYPVYIDTNVMAGNAGNHLEQAQYSNIVYLPCNESNNFIPEIPDFHVDLIYLCSPNNPTGAVMRKKDLEKWIEYAIQEKAVIFFDAAYERFISEDDIPHSIFEIDNAKNVAIEFRSFSKTAGFTGVRCAYTVIPKNLQGYDSKQNAIPIHALWSRRQSTKFNGVSYPTQKAAAAVYSEKGSIEIKKLINYYKKNAEIIRLGLKQAGFRIFGGINSPYIWLKSLHGESSWELFDFFLEKLNIIGTPGSGFGPNGKGYFRLSAFGSRENTQEAINRIKKYFIS
ncbi:LL-diaminopimelate aminotransferase [Candidatus Harpocratesius sp.]